MSETVNAPLRVAVREAECLPSGRTSASAKSQGGIMKTNVQSNVSASQRDQYCRAIAIGLSLKQRKSKVIRNALRAYLEALDGSPSAAVRKECARLASQSLSLALRLGS